MKTILLPLAAALIAAPVQPLAAGNKASEKGEGRIARAVEGRVAGDPVDCIDMRKVRNTIVIPETAIVYDAGRTIYVNRPRGGARSLDSWDVLVTRLHSSELCTVDPVHLYDSTLRMPTGFVSLGEFVPYRKPARGD
jgi:hypothetical protein